MSAAPERGECQRLDRWLSAYVDDELSSSTYTTEREAELEVLTRPEASERLRAEGIRLATFGAVAA